MESTGQDAPPQPQLLLLGRKDTTRLLEVYVKRSLSVNDGGVRGRRPGEKPRKWVALAEKAGRIRRRSSDSDAHLSPDEVAAVIAGFQPAPADGPTEGPTESPPGARLESSMDPPEGEPTQRPTFSRLDSSTEQKRDDRLPKKGAKKSKKPSLLKSFLNLFSRRGGDKKEERKSSSPERGGTLAPLDTPSPSISCLPLHGPSSDGVQCSPQARRSFRRKSIRRKFSFRNRGTDHPRRSLKKPNTLALSETEHIQNPVCVAPTSLYYEKVSEELEKIVKEVKDSPTDEGRSIFDQSPESLRTRNAKEAEVIERIINLIKQQGDDINEELKTNDGGVGSLFHTLSYGSFRQLADLYVESGGAPPVLPPEGVPTAPELVKFAFTLDFTAKVAGLSSQTLGRIMGFGNQYLQDRFTQMSVAHRTEGQLRPEQNFSGPD